MWWFYGQFMPERNLRSIDSTQRWVESMEPVNMFCWNTWSLPSLAVESSVGRLMICIALRADVQAATIIRWLYGPTRSAITCTGISINSKDYQRTILILCSVLGRWNCRQRVASSTLGREVATLSRSFIHIAFVIPSSINCTGDSWDGNHRSGVAPALLHMGY